MATRANVVTGPYRKITGRHYVPVRCAAATVADERPNVHRRHITVAAILGTGLFIAQAADAQNAIEAKKRADERKEKLKQAAEEMRSKQVATSAFADSKYAVSENKDPNVHSRQEEGARSQTNV